MELSRGLAARLGRRAETVDREPSAPAPAPAPGNCPLPKLEVIARGACLMRFKAQSMIYNAERETVDGCLMRRFPVEESYAIPYTLAVQPTCSWYNIQVDLGGRTDGGSMQIAETEDIPWKTE